MKISIKNLENSTLRVTADSAVSWLSSGDSRDVEFSKSISVEQEQRTGIELAIAQAAADAALLPTDPAVAPSAPVLVAAPAPTATGY